MSTTDAKRATNRTISADVAFATPNANVTQTPQSGFAKPTDKLLECIEADRDLLQRVMNVLDLRGYGPHKALEINVERGVVMVQGRVPTFYLRQIAVECIKRVAGVTQVLDLIKVVGESDQPRATGSLVDGNGGSCDRHVAALCSSSIQVAAN